MGNDPEVSSSQIDPGAASLFLDVTVTMTLSELRSWVRSLTGPSPDLELLVTELVTNARQHGEAGPITVELRLRVGHVEVVVANPHSGPPPVVPPDQKLADEHSARGRGLHIVSAIADQLVVEQDGSTLRISAVVPL